MKPRFGLLEQMRAHELATGRKVRVRRPTVQTPPLAAERGYTAALLRIVRAIAKDIRDELTPERLAYMLRMAGTAPSLDHADQSDVATLIDTTEGQLLLKLDNEHLRNLTGLVEQYFQMTARHGRRQLIRQIRRAISIDAMAPEPALDAMMDLWVKEGHRLITKMSEDQITDTMNIARRGIRAGDRPGLIAEKIRAKTGIAERKARLIARDQTNKLHGQMTKMRHEALGIESYIWRTSRDERVRPSHMIKEGVEFRWDDPPYDTGHPGEQIQCRCTSEPVIPGLAKPKDEPASAKKAAKLKREARAKLKAKEERAKVKSTRSA